MAGQALQMFKDGTSTRKIFINIYIHPLSDTPLVVVIVILVLLLLVVGVVVVIRVVVVVDVFAIVYYAITMPYQYYLYHFRIGEG